LLVVVEEVVIHLPLVVAVLVLEDLEHLLIQKLLVVVVHQKQV